MSPRSSIKSNNNEWFNIFIVCLIWRSWVYAYFKIYELSKNCFLICLFSTVNNLKVINVCNLLQKIIIAIARNKVKWKILTVPMGNDRPNIPYLKFIIRLLESLSYWGWRVQSKSPWLKRSFENYSKTLITKT